MDLRNELKTHFYSKMSLRCLFFSTDFILLNFPFHNLTCTFFTFVEFNRFKRKIKIYGH